MWKNLPATSSCAMEADEDVPTLSAETFAALQEFYAEQSKRQEILVKLEADKKLTENILFDENWVCLWQLIFRIQIKIS